MKEDFGNADTLPLGSSQGAAGGVGARLPDPMSCGGAHSELEGIQSPDGHAGERAWERKGGWIEGERGKFLTY